MLFWCWIPISPHLWNKHFSSSRKEYRGKQCCRKTVMAWVCLGIPETKGPCGSASQESDSYAGDLGLIPGLGGSPGEGKGYPFQYSGMEKSMDCMYSPWSHKELDMTERLSFHLTYKNWVIEIVLTQIHSMMVQNSGWLINSSVSKYIIDWIYKAVGIPSH